MVGGVNLKKIIFLIVILVVILSGCSDLKTPGEAIKPPKNNMAAIISQDGNLPLWVIRSNGERFFDTGFISNDKIVTLVYKDGGIYLRTYKKSEMIKEKFLGTKADYRILDRALDRFVVKKGETEITLYDDKLNTILNFDVDVQKDAYQKNVLDAILSPDGNVLVISNVHYKDNYPVNGEFILFNKGKIVKKIDKVIPQLANFSDDSSKFLFVDLNSENKANNTFLYNREGNLIKGMKMPIYSSTMRENLNITKVSAALSGDGNAILFSNYYGDGLYIEKLNENKIKIPMATERFYTNKNATKFVIGNYGVSKIYDGYGKLLDYIVVNYGLINDVHFEGNNTFFAVNGTTVPNSKSKDYIGVMDESGNMVWTAKVYDTVAMIRFSPDGKRIMAQSSRFISVYDYHNGKVDVIPRPINGKYPESIWKKLLNEDIDAENAFIFTDELGNIYAAKNRTLTKATKNGNKFWVVDTSKPIKFFALSQNGEMIALAVEGDNGSEIIVYNKSGMVISHKYIRNGHQITSIAVSPDGKYFSYAVSTPENEEYGSFIDLFNDKGYMIWEQKIKSIHVYKLDINKNVVTACFNDGKFSGYLALDFSGKMLYNKDMKNNMPFIKSSRNGQIFFIRSLDDEFAFYNREGMPLSESYTNKGIIQDVLMSEDGKIAVLISYSEDYKKYDITFFNNFKAIKNITSDWGITKAVMTPDGKYVVILSREYSNIMNNANKLTMYDSEGNTLYTYYHKSGIYDISITDDGTNLYLYCADGYVYRYRNK